MSDATRVTQLLPLDEAIAKSDVLALGAPHDLYRSLDLQVRRGIQAPESSVHMGDRRSLTGASLAAETGESRDEESRLQPGLAAPQSRPICQSAAGLPTRPTKRFRVRAQVEGFWDV
jgi:hypothetical protein